jgi:hypothetical protein
MEIKKTTLQEEVLADYTYNCSVVGSYQNRGLLIER